MSSVVAIVKSIVGQVIAISPEGIKRVLVEGDHLLAGERIETGASGAVSLQLADGRVLDVGRDSQWSAANPQISTQVGEGEQVAATHAPSAAELQQAIADGVDPTKAFEAPAAGVTQVTDVGPGGEAGGGHSFVVLDATGATVAPTIGFNTAGLENGAAAGTEQTDALPLRASTLTLSATSSVAETGGVVTYTATLTQAPVSPLTITLSNGQVITIAAGQLTGSVNVTFADTNDAYIDAHTVAVTVTGTTGGQGLVLTTDPTPATTLVTDTIDPTQVTITAPAGTVTEGSSVTYTISVANAPQTNLVLTLSDGNTVTIAAGKTSVDYTVNVGDANHGGRGDDIYAQGTTSTTLTVTGVANGADGNLESVVTTGATVTTSIVDNATPTQIGFSDHTASVNEGSAATYTVNVPTTTAPLTLTLSYSGTAIPGTAGAGNTDVTPGGSNVTFSNIVTNAETGITTATVTVVLPAGQNSFTLGTLTDSQLEGTEGLTLTLTGVTGGGLENPTVDGALSTVSTDIVDQTVPTATGTGGNATTGAGGDSVVGSEDTPINLSWSNFNVQQAAAGETPDLGVRITSIPNGTLVLTVNGVSTTVAAGDIITKAELDNGTLVFTPAANAASSGTGAGSVQDLYGAIDFQPVNNATSANPLVGAQASIGLVINAVADTPTLTAPGTVSGAEDTPIAITGVSTALVDTDGSETLTTTVSGLPAGSVITYQNAAGVTITKPVAADGATTDITDANLATLAVTPPLNYNSQVNGDIQLTISSYTTESSNGATSTPNTQTVTLVVTPVNDAPTIAAPTAQTTAEDTPLTFSSANGNAITVADVDSGTSPIKVDVTVSGGTLVLTDGTTSTTNNGVVTLTGTPAQINAQLEGATFTPTLNANDTNGSTAGLSITVNDQGNTGAGGALSATQPISIDVTPVNDAPTISAPTSQTVAEDTPLTFSAANGNAITVADVDSGTSPIKVDVTVSGGTLVLTDGTTSTTTNGVVTLTGTPAQINAQLEGATFTPTLNANDTNGSTAGLSITVNDQGNTGAGGALSATQPISIDVTPVNDAPVANNDIGTTITGSLQGNYYGYQEGTDGPNLGTIQQALSFIGSHSANASFSSTNVNYGGSYAAQTFSDNLGTTSNLGKFLGTDASSLTYANGTTQTTTSDAIVELTGKVTMAAGDYSLRITADDGYVVYIDGKQVAAVDANQPSTTDDFKFSIATSGAHDIQIVYWDQGTFAQLTVEVAPVTAGVVGAYGVLGQTDTAALAHDTLTTLEDQPLVIKAATLLANDTDVDGDTLTINSLQGTDGKTPSAVKDADGKVVGTVVLDGNGDVIFTPAKDINGLVTFSYTVTDGQATSNTAIVTVNVVAVNDAPTISAPLSQTIAEDTPLTFSTANGNAITVADVDSSTSPIKVDVTATGGILILADGTSSATNNGVVTLTGTPAQINAQLQGATFTPTLNANDNNGSTAGLTVSVNDQGNTGIGGALTTTQAISIDVTPVNDAPTISAPASQTIAEDTPLTFSSANGNAITVADVDSSTTPIKVDVTVSGGTLVLTDGTTSTTNNGVVTLTGTPAQINAQLEGATFTPTLNANDTNGSTAGLSITVNDQGNTGAGGALSATQPISIDVTPVNDAPTISAPTSQTVAEDTPLTFSAANGNAITVADVDSGTSPIKVDVTVSGGTLVLTDGTTSTTNNGVVTLTGTPAQINAQLEGATFTPTLNANDTNGSTAGLSITVNDQGNTGAGGALLATQPITIDVTPVNDAPTISAPTSQTVAEDTPLTFSAANGNAITVADVDSGTSPIKVDVTVSGGTLVLTDGTTSTTTNGVVTLTGTPAQINAQLEGATFTPTLNANDTNGSTAGLSITVNDQGNTGAGGALSATQPISINVTPVDDAPTIAAPTTAVNTAEDTPLVFSQANGNAISIGDVDAGNSNVTITIDVTGGTLALNGNVGTTSPDGTQVTLTGTLTQINAALEGAKFTPAPDSNNSTTPANLSITVDDLGNSGALPAGATSLTTTQLVKINVTPVNDAPVVGVTDRSAAFVEDQGGVALVKGFTVTDVDNNIAGKQIHTATVTLSQYDAATGDSLTSSKFTGSINTTGAVTSTTYAGVTYTASVDATTGKLTIVFTGDANRADYAELVNSLTFNSTNQGLTAGSRDVTVTVTDTGENNAGLMAQSATVNSTLSITPVDDAPTINIVSTSPVTEHAATVGQTVATYTTADPDGPLPTVTLTNNSNGYYALGANNTVTLTQAGLDAVNAGKALPDVSLHAADASVPTTLFADATAPIAVNYANQAPVVTDAQAITYTENDANTPIFLTSGNTTAGSLSIVDTDSSGTLQGAKIVLTNVQSGDQFTSTLTNGNLGSSGSIAVNGTTIGYQITTATVAGKLVATVTLNGTTSIQNYEAVLNSIKFSVPGDAPNTAARSVDISVQDTGSVGQSGTDATWSNVAHTDITVVNTPDAPTISIVSTNPVTEHSATVGQTVATYTIADPDGPLPTVTLTNDPNHYYALGANNTVTLTQAGLDAVNAGKALPDVSLHAADASVPATLFADATAPIAVNYANQAPVVTDAQAITYTENDANTPIFLTSGNTTAGSLSIVDTDSSGTLKAASIVLTNFQSGDTFTSSYLTGPLSTSGSFAIDGKTIGYTVTPGTNAAGLATSTVTLSGVATVAEYQALLNSIKFSAPGDNPSAAPRSVDISVTDTGTAALNGSDAKTSVVAHTDVTVVPVNDAPVAVNDGALVGGLTGKYYGYAETSANGNLGTIAKALAYIASHQADASFTSTSVNYGGTAFSNDLGHSGNLSSFLGSDSRSLTYANGTATQTTTSDAIIELSGQVNLKAATYSLQISADDGYSVYIDGKQVAAVDKNQSATTNAFQFTVATAGAHDIQIVYWDQGGYAKLQASLATVTGNKVGDYTVLGTVDAPVTHATFSTLEDQPLVITPATLLANDTDVDTPHDQLTVVGLQGVSLADAAHLPANVYATGTTTVIGTVGINSLGNVVFTPAKDYNGQASFTYTISDGQGGTSTATVSLDVIAVSDAPTLDLSPSNTTTADTTASFTEKAGAVAIAPAGLITDPDSANMSGATVTLTNAKASDVLSVGNSTATSGTTNGIAWTIVGTPATGTATSIAVNLTGAASKSAYQALIDSITFNNTSTNPDTTSRSVTVVVKDDDGLTSNTATSVISVAAVNDAPTAASSTVTGTEGTATAIAWSTFGVADVDSATTSLGIVFTALPAHGTLQYQNAAGAWVTLTTADLKTSSSTGTVFTSASHLQFVTDASTDASNSKATTGTTGNQGHDYATLSFQATDGNTATNNGYSATQTVTLDVTAVANGVTLGVTTPTYQSTDLTYKTWNSAITNSSTAGWGLGTNGNGAATATLIANINAHQSTTPTTAGTLTNISASNVDAGTATKASGLVYLEAGKTYTFSGTADDSFAVTIGGKVVATETWSSGSAIVSSSFTPATSGFYTLGIYHFNQSGPGNYNLNVSVNGATATSLSASGLVAYESVADAQAHGVTLSALNGTNGEGVYTASTVNHGLEGTIIKLSSITANLVDSDGSETKVVTLSGLPAGSSITDVNGNVLASVVNGTATVSSLDLTQLYLKTAVGSFGSYAVTVSAYSKESDTAVAPSATSTATFTVVVDHKAPSVDLDSNDSTASANDYVTSYATPGTAISIADTDISVGVTDATNTLKSATVTLQNFTAGDSFTATGLPAGIVATVTTSASATDKIITFTSTSGSASAADFQAAIQAVKYSNNGYDSGAATASTRTVTVSVDDGTTASNHVSQVATTTINVAAETYTTQTGAAGTDDLYATSSANTIMVGDVSGTQPVKGASYNLAFIVDTSGSMGDTVAGTGKSALANAIAQLTQVFNDLKNSLTGDHAGTVNVFLENFSTNVGTTVSVNLADANALNTLINKMSTYSATGRTDYEAAFQSANAWFATHTATNGVTNLTYFITDGTPNEYLSSNGTPVQGSLAAAVNAASDDFATLKSASTVYAIGLGGSVDSNTLAKFDSDGVVQNNVSAKDLAAAIHSTTAPVPAGDDTVVGSTGNDILFGDTVTFTPTSGSVVEGAEALRAYVTSATHSSTSVTDEVLHQYITNHISEFNGSVATTGGTLTVATTGGNDTLLGGDGNDIIFGQGGGDTLQGGAGNDILLPGSGNNTMWGGTGADTFMWLKGDTGTNVIKDFSTTEGDKLDLSDLLQTATVTNIADYIKATTDSSGTTLSINTSGKIATAAADVTIHVDNVSWSNDTIKSLVAGSDPTIKVDHH